MDDYIPRVTVRNALYEADAITMKGVAILNQFPAADVVEVVRCRDCVYWRGENDWCEGIGIDFSENGYCSFGKRKNGGQDNV